METDRIRELIDLLKSLKGKRPDIESLDIPERPQTEEEYRREQAEWLEQVRRRKETSSDK